MNQSPDFVRYLCSMAQPLEFSALDSRSDQYAELGKQWESLFRGERNRIANLANVTAVLKSAFGWHWIGFYLVDFKEDQLVLGPFQGPLACTRLFHGKGVCAAAWDQKRPQLVPNVEEFNGHVACSSLTQSEMVLPIIVDDRVVAVLDIDSEHLADFSNEDLWGLTRLVDCIAEHWDQWE